MTAGDRPVDVAALAAIRPGDPKAKLAAAAGGRWLAPMPALAGWVRYLEDDFGFTARLTRDDCIGEVNFLHRFPSTVSIDGFAMGMPDTDIERALPALTLTEAGALSGPYRFGCLALDGDRSLNVETSHGVLSRLWMTFDKADYPDFGPMPLDRPKSSFDFAIVPGFRAGDAAAPDGWCCGLPRGIDPIQWPLSSRTGFPLEHHFTVRVPEAYRVKGSGHIALAVFSDAADESPTAPAVAELMNTVFDGRMLPEQVAPDLQPFLDHLVNRHPLEFRSKDILGATFAAIWLTEVELSRAPCPPPEQVVTAANAMCSPPHWFRTSAAERFFGWDGGEAFNADYFLHRLAGRRPTDRWDILALKATERTDDPNTGRCPADWFDAPDNRDGYVPKYSDEWNALGISVDYAGLHFGGTVNTGQAVPQITPFFVEFDEIMGQINMGGYEGRIDLLTMQFHS